MPLTEKEERTLEVWFLKDIIKSRCSHHHQGEQCQHQIEAKTKLAVLEGGTLDD